MVVYLQPPNFKAVSEEGGKLWRWKVPKNLLCSLPIYKFILEREFTHQAFEFHTVPHLTDKSTL